MTQWEFALLQTFAVSSDAISDKFPFPSYDYPVAKLQVILLRCKTYNVPYPAIIYINTGDPFIKDGKFSWHNGQLISAVVLATAFLEHAGIDPRHEVKSIYVSTILPNRHAHQRKIYISIAITHFPAFGNSNRHLRSKNIIGACTRKVT